MRDVAETRRTFEARLQETREATHQQLGVRPDRAWVLPIIAAAAGMALAGLAPSLWRGLRAGGRR